MRRPEAITAVICDERGLPVRTSVVLTANATADARAYGAGDDAVAKIAGGDWNAVDWWHDSVFYTWSRIAPVPVDAEPAAPCGCPAWDAGVAYCEACDRDLPAEERATDA